MSANTGGELGPVGAALVAWIGAGYLFTMDTLSFNTKLLVGGVLVIFGIASILGVLR
ncbi:hypothetical protein EGH21_23915 [Halomicroarcula sp. F13]|uniref:Uncharacterized protein n=1 Tax=Haloarcula rubra TaxID=2487747 RepID=A0AAW4PY48_9EURY|nr:hypothetical protein [Halomicroarcula rubra]MBX0326061.1 hypothetical protein [Halomicroarcula rubra]